jgi:N-acyl homoserine lactone hydrolase
VPLVFVKKSFFSLREEKENAMTNVTRLYVFQLGLFVEEGAGAPIPVPGYLIQTSDHTNILVDSGYPLDGSFVPDKGNTIEMFSIVEQLAALNVRPEDINMLVCTHLDPDHSGNHELFPHAEMIVQRSHYEFARSSTSLRFTLTRPHWDRPHLRYRLVEGDTELVPGVQLIETSGHVPGHQSLLVYLPETGPVLLTSDAVFRQRSFTPDRKEEARDLNAEDALASTHKLLNLAKKEQVSLVIFGHDGEQWPAIKKSPQFYA